MKKQSMKSFLKSLVALMLCMCMGGSALADVLTLPAGVKVIEEEAFFGDTSLDEVVLPDGVEEIGPRAFAESSVSKVNLPDSITEIGENAFDLDEDIELSANEGSYAHEWLEERGYYDDTESPLTDFEFTDNGDGTCNISKYIGSARNVVIPQKDGNGRIVTSIGDEAFNSNSSLSSITIPNSVTSIGSWAFNACSSLSSIKFSESVTSIGSWAFNACSSLSSITIPEGLTSIAEGVFLGCSNLSSITIPESVTSIEGAAFRDCSSLSSITIPESVTSIEGAAFQYCSSLSSITLPEGVTSIGPSAFMSCTNLSDITIPESMTSIGSYAFYDCRSLSNITIPHGVTSIEESTFYGCRSLISITIPDSVTNIGYSAFKKCSSLTDITIPDGVTSIGPYAFYDCNLVIYANLDTDGAKALGKAAYCFRIPGSYYDLIYLYDNDEISELEIRNVDKDTENIAFPEGVTSIGAKAFENCMNLSEVLIPEGVTSIGYYAFAGCKNLSSITVPDSVTTIEDCAFRFCSSLSSIIIPNGVTSIESGTFHYCRNLSSITIPDSVTSIGSCAFESCSSLTSVTLPEGVTSIDGRAFSYCTNLSDITIPYGVTEIRYETFDSCSSLSSITIPNSVTFIEPYAFRNCSSLTSITIPDSVKTMYGGIFYYCSGLSSIIIPSSVTYIFADIFINCTSLTSIYCVENSYAWQWFYNVYHDKLIPWDGDPSSLPEENQLTGSFADSSMTISLGGSLQTPAATVRSNGNPIYRVSFTINGWSQDESGNDRYRTHTFEGLNLHEISLTDPEWANDYILDTTQPPLNVPGEYTLNLWASLYDNDTSGVKLDSMTVNVGRKAYVQGFKTDTYPDSTSTEPNGYVNNADPVLAIREENGRCYIQMKRDAGNYVLRWVDKNMIADTYWQWTGYVHAVSVPTYPDAVSTVSNGSVSGNNDVTVLVIGAEGSRYQIKTIINTCWVEKRWIKNTPWSGNEITIVKDFADNVVDRDATAKFEITVPDGIDSATATINFYRIDASYKEQFAPTEQVIPLEPDENGKFTLRVTNPLSMGAGADIHLEYKNGDIITDEDDLDPFYFIKLIPETPVRYWTKVERKGRVINTPWNSISFSELAPTISELSLNQKVRLLGYDDSGVSYIAFDSEWGEMKAFTVGELSEKPNLEIILEIPAVVRPEEQFTVRAVIQPKEAVVTDLCWRIDDCAIVSVPGERYDGGALDGLRSGDITSFTFRAITPGSTKIYAYTPDEVVAAEAKITVDNIEESVTYEEYYDLLNSSTESKLINDDRIYNQMLSVLLADGMDEDNANDILTHVKGADNTYSNLYVWSFMDYGRCLGAVDKTRYRIKLRKILIKNKDVGDIATWFHESAHAMDFNVYISTFYSKRKVNLYNELYSHVYDIIETQVDETIQDLNLEISSSEKEKIISEIMGPANSPTLTTPKRQLTQWIETINSSLYVYEIPMPSTIDEKYQELWDKSLVKITDYADTKASLIWVTNIGFDVQGFWMHNDMISGFTNNTILVESGHDIETSGTDYWYQNGHPTYLQNMEAWAEYYSSVMVGKVNDNLKYFDKACTTMDRMAEELLNLYIIKHSR